MCVKSILMCVVWGVCTETIQGRLSRGTPSDSNADQYFRPFELAIRNKTPKIRAAALDCVEKLIGMFCGVTLFSWSLLTWHEYEYSTAYGYLRGLSPVTGGSVPEGSNLTLMDLLIQSIADVQDDPNDSVQLQVIKALLTAVTSPETEVHETSLMLAIRACYHIFLVSKNAVNRTTAKASLTQTLNFVFQRMEAHAKDALIRQEHRNGTTTGAPLASPPPAVPDEPEDTGTNPVIPGMYTAVLDALHLNVMDGDLPEVDTEDESSKSAPVVDRDVHQVFRALCRLSMKDSDASDPTVNSEAVAVRSRVCIT